MEDAFEFLGSVYNLHLLAWSPQAGVKCRAVEPSQRGVGWLWGPDCSSEGKKATFGFSTVIWWVPGDVSFSSHPGSRQF